jgi:Myb-like DNA-binding domain
MARASIRYSLTLRLTLVNCYQLLPSLLLQICAHMPGRVGKQCRERYLNHLDPSLKKTPWTDAEDELLMQLHSKLNNAWAEIARQIPGMFYEFI